MYVLFKDPQVPGIVTARSDATNDTMVEWSRPLMANGRLEFYEVAVTQLRNDEIIRKRISIVNGTSCSVRIPTCTDNEYKTKIDVRAVNVVNISESYDDTNNYDATNSVAFYYTSNEDLRCLGSIDNDQGTVQQYAYDTTDKYNFYRSDWQYGPNYNCAVVSRLSRNTMVALLVIVSTLGVMVGLYLARQKYNKMANINCTLPPGLDIYLTKDGAFSGTSNECNTLRNLSSYHNNNSNNNNVAAGIVSVAMNCTSSDGHNFHNEEHHLLASIGSDSGYLDEAAAAGKRCLNDVRGLALQQQNHTAIPADYVRSHSQCSSDSLVGSNASTAEAELCETNLQVSMMPTYYMKAENLNNGWNAGSILQRSQHVLNQERQEKKDEEEKDHDEEEEEEDNNEAEEYDTMNLNNCCSNYVPVESIKQKPPTFSGSSDKKPMRENLCDYTTLEQVGYMSGYVTPGELNAFGQQQQQEQQQLQQYQLQQHHQRLFE